MSRKLALLMPLMIVLTNILGVGVRVESVEAGGTIYIKADGSVNPPTAPILNVGNVHYTLTADISDSIVVERDNIAIDGAGYTVERVGEEASIESKGKVRSCLNPGLDIEPGPEPETVPGIDLSRRSNVTIKDTNIKGFDDGVYLYGSSNNVISGNNITDNWCGVMLEESSENNRIHGNNLTNNTLGIKLWGSCDHNILSGNNLTNGGSGIELFGSCNFNSVCGNHIANNNYTGIDLYASLNNDIYGNNITANDSEGIRLDSSYNNGIFENHIADNKHTGLALNSFSENNSISRNHIANNDEGIALGYCSNNNIYGNDVRANNDTGIKLYDSSTNCICGNRVTDNPWGVVLEGSFNNKVYGNRMANNNYIGILIWYSSENNSVHGNDVTDNAWGIVFQSSSNNSVNHNNFVNNTVQVYDYSWNNPEATSSANTWDNGYPSGGNYWSDYNGTDYYSGPYQNEMGSDNIGDISYVIDSNNRDRYPLMEMIPEDTKSPNIAVLSPENKTYAVNDVALTFTINEAIVWIGFCLDDQGNVTIAGNTTLSDLSSDAHSLVVFAEDIAGNAGASEIVEFTIETTAPLPISIIAAIITAAGVGASLLIYFTKFKRTTQKVK